MFPCVLLSMHDTSLRSGYNIWDLPSLASGPMFALIVT